MQQLTETIKTTPLQAERSVRTLPMKGMTSGKAGQVIPLGAELILREDRVARGEARIRVNMMETGRKLATGINVTAYVHFVPFLAFERFAGLDMLNASYKGVELREGDGIVPFFETKTYDPAEEIAKAMGIHAANGATINTLVEETYNTIWNYRAQARSAKLAPRLKSDTTLARAFWKNPEMAHIVPDFDQAMIDGEVELNLTGLLPVYGIGHDNSPNYTHHSARHVGGDHAGKQMYSAQDAIYLKEDPDNPGYPLVQADLQEAAVNLSLSNIEMAKKSAWFARIRKKMAGLDDDAIIDLLMEGIRVPDAQLSQPILLDRRSTLVGYNERYATDAANLDVSRTNGMTELAMRWRTPHMNTGGVIMITLEIVPEQLNERMSQPLTHITNVADLPNFTRDFLDPEKVEIVKNGEIDVEHSAPDATFGYAPLNARFKKGSTHIGGKYFKRLGDPWTEDRQAFWAVDTVDQELTTDFYLVPDDLPHTVFASQNSDPFEIYFRGRQQIVGNTVFGKGLEENTDDYAHVKGQVDTDRIEQTP